MTAPLDTRICGQLHRAPDDLFGSVLSACWRDLGHAGSCGDEPEQRFVKSWQPRVGQRVRIVLNGECQLRPCEGSYYARIGQIGHPSYEQGLTGTVSSFHDVTEAEHDVMAQQGHLIDVEYDRHVYPTLPDGRLARGGTYCAFELEPLDDEEDRP